MHNEVTKVLVLLVFFSVSNPPSMHIGYPQARLARSCLIVFVLAASVLNTALVGVCHPFTSTPPARQCELAEKGQFLNQVQRSVQRSTCLREQD